MSTDVEGKSFSEDEGKESDILNSAHVLNEILGSTEDEIWDRQESNRLLKRKGDNLEEIQNEARIKLLYETRADRLLCQAAREAKLTDSYPEGSLDQAEQAASIRKQAENVGIPWRGLTVEELITCIKQEAESKKEGLNDLLNFSLSLIERSNETLKAIEVSREVVKDSSINVESNINAMIDRLHKLVDRRQVELIKCLKNIEKEKTNKLISHKRATENAKVVLNEVIELGNNIKLKDDIRLLKALHEDQTYLDSLLEQVDDGPHLKKPDPDQEIRQSWDMSIPNLIYSYGTIGPLLGDWSVDTLGSKIGWDLSRCDDALKISGDNLTVQHVGKHESRAIAISRFGSNEGTVAFRFQLSGLGDSQWIALGVTTATKLNMPGILQDSIIFEVGNGDSGPENASTVQDNDYMTMVVDCNNLVVEYYQNGIQCKLAALSSMYKVRMQNNEARFNESKNEQNEPQEYDFKIGKSQKTIYPFCILFNPGQSVTFMP